MINRRVAALLVLFTPLAACVSGTSGSGDSNPNSGFQARFVPLGGIMPFPNDLYFNGSTTGTLNIPGSATVAQNGPLLQLNHLDGFGTQSDISIYFTQPVNKTTLTPANIIVLKVTSDPSTKAVTGFTKPLVPGTDYSVELSPGIDSGGEVVTIKPLHPLDPSTVNPSTHVATPSTYLVIVTKGVKDSTGATVSPSSDFSTIVTADTPAVLAGGNPAKIAMAATDPLFPVAEFSLGQLAVAAGAGLTPDKVAVTFSFSTAYLNISLAELAVAAITSPPSQPASGTGIFTTGKTVCDVLVLSKQLPNTAACAAVLGSTDTDVYAGDLALPYYLTVPSATNPTAALTDFWKNAKGGDTAISATDATSFVPKATVTQNIIPVLVAIPNAGSVCGGTMPGGGWPVAIFQHGITRNREDMLAMASGLSARACIAVIAIDLPLHGITDKTDPFYKNQLFAGTAVAAALTLPVSERTFDMDLENNTTLASGPDGTIDSSGAWFINLNNTITSRDNLRQGAADLINLVANLPNLHPIGAVTNSFNSSAVFFVGHSLGGIVGTTFLGADSAAAQLTATSPKILGAIVANPGGHIAELLRNSAEFEPIIDGQLAANGLVKGTQSYYDFYSEAQAVVEDGDPANYAAAAAGGHLIHMLEVVGGFDAGSPSDLVVPNSATDALIAEMGITTPVSTLGPNAIAVRAPTLAQFTSGDHGSFLSPAAPTGASTTDMAAYAAVTTEMQTEMVQLFGSILASTPATVVTSNTYLSTTLKK
ncbi:MAG TPA: hypothetical protein VGO35_07635 [Gammaproteobacteria bacterium]|jgi:pimeloyl-ACP methyl ester carboxylesterase|nr:hypothetical protein [Gammaproteobacteria bacterium]